ncbi:hypothetical protein ES708_02284 [subsurface metagenome]
MNSSRCHPKIPVAGGTRGEMTKKQFNIRFLLATRPYMPKVARALVRDCRDDIKIFGLNFAQQKWAKFIRS